MAALYPTRTLSSYTTLCDTIKRDVASPNSLHEVLAQQTGPPRGSYPYRASFQASLKGRTITGSHVETIFRAGATLQNGRMLPILPEGRKIIIARERKNAFSHLLITQRADHHDGARHC